MRSPTDVLAEIGMAIAEAVGRATVAALEGAAPEAPFAADPGLTYTRAARAVRLTIALQSRLTKELMGLDRARTDARRARAFRLVDRAIEAEHDDDDEIERLGCEARERLTDAEDCGDLALLPLAETVARICRDLGLSPDWGAEVWEESAHAAAPSTVLDGGIIYVTKQD